MADAIRQLLKRAPHSGFVVGLDGLAQVHAKVDVVDVLVLEARRLADPTTFSRLMDDSTLLTSPGLRSLVSDTSAADREARAAMYAAARLPQITERLVERHRHRQAV